MLQVARQAVAQFIRDAVTHAVQDAQTDVNKIPDNLRNTIQEMGAVEVYYDEVHPNTLYLELPDGAGYRVTLIMTHPAMRGAQNRVSVQATDGGPRKGRQQEAATTA